MLFKRLFPPYLYGMVQFSFSSIMDIDVYGRNRWSGDTLILEIGEIKASFGEEQIEKAVLQLLSYMAILDILASRVFPENPLRLEGVIFFRKQEYNYDKINNKINASYEENSKLFRFRQNTIINISFEFV